MIERPPIQLLDAIPACAVDQDAPVGRQRHGRGQLGVGWKVHGQTNRPTDLAVPTTLHRPDCQCRADDCDEGERCDNCGLLPEPHANARRNAAIESDASAAVSNAPSESLEHTSPMSPARCFGSFRRHFRRSVRAHGADRNGGRKCASKSGSRAERRRRQRDVFVVECAPTGQHLQQHGAEGPDVRASVHDLAARLLRAHVGGGAENHSRLRHRQASAVVGADR